jgi:hypothetical protein
MQTVLVGGASYSIPSPGEAVAGNVWGTNLPQFFVALTQQLNTVPTLISTVAVSTTPVTVQPNQMYLVDSSVTAITLNLPQPVASRWFWMKDTGNNSATNHITLHRFAGEKIEGSASDYAFSFNGASVLVFTDDLGNWWLFGGTPPPLQPGQIIVGGNANSVLFEGPSQSLATTPNLTFDGTELKVATSHSNDQTPSILINNFNGGSSSNPGLATWGLVSSVSSDTSEDKFGVYGLAQGNNGNKYAVYGLASGGGKNWAGYFNGNVGILNGLCSSTLLTGAAVVSSLVTPALKLTTGASAGSVLTSDAAGNGTWQSSGSSDPLTISKGITANALTTTTLLVSSLAKVGTQPGVTTTSSAVPTYDLTFTTGAYFDQLTTHNLRIYSFKVVAGQKIFSSTYFQTPTFSDDNLQNAYYYITWSWAAVSGADGYRVFMRCTNNTGNGPNYNYDVYQDVFGTSFQDGNVPNPGDGNTTDPAWLSGGTVANSGVMLEVVGSVQVDGTSLSALGNFSVVGSVSRGGAIVDASAVNLGDASSQVNVTGSVVSGGSNNKVKNDSSFTLPTSGSLPPPPSSFGNVVAGGSGNTASGFECATVSGGLGNYAAGSFSTVPGGLQNVASGDYSVAMGTRAIAQHNNTFVFNDNSSNFTSVQTQEFAVSAANGFRLVSSGVEKARITTSGISTTALVAGTVLDRSHVNLSVNGITGTGAQTATITNSPTSGNPTTYLRMSINGVSYWIPAWA